MPGHLTRCAAILSLSWLIVAGLGAALVSCGKGEPTKAQKAEAKRVKDAALLALPYPASSGVLPRSIEISYDGATDRTSMKLRLSGMRVSGGGSANVGGVTLHLTSSHKGRVRPKDDPEGSVDGSLVAEVSSPGMLAYSGVPGNVTADGETTPLKASTDKDGYVSAKATGGREEVVRFRFPTKDLVRATAATSVTMSFGTIQIDISGQQLSDLREFAARMNPKP